MKKLALSLLMLLTASAVFADCPQPDQIHLNCGTNQFSHLCNWQAPWYEGFTKHNASIQGNILPIEKFQFVKVFWGRKDGQTSGDGSTLCYYLNQDGTTVMMVQNSWGNVPKPKNHNWMRAVDDEGNPGKVCFHGCHFPYGS